MTAIQIALILFLLVASALAWMLLKRQLFIRLFFMLQFLTGIAFVVSPDLSTQVASLLGIGRGTDLVLYFLVMFVYFAGLCIIGKFRQIERRQTLLAREIAILKANNLEHTKPEHSRSQCQL